MTQVPRQHSRETTSTILGFAAILIWSSSVAFTRSAAEQLGVLTSSFLVYTTGGAIGCMYLVWTGQMRQALALPRRFLVGGGALFAVYMLSFASAVGLAVDGQQVVEVGLINYLWPGLTLVFSVPIQKYRATPFLGLGILVALAGVFLSSLGQQPLSPEAIAEAWMVFGRHLQSYPVPFILALVAAVTWSLYSNLSRRLASDAQSGAVPLFLLASGLAFGVLRLFRPERSHWSLEVGLEVVYLTVFACLLAYAFWDRAMRRGRMTLVAAASYATPLLSTLIVSAKQDVPMGPSLWLACLLIVAGAVVCKLSVKEARIRVDTEGQVHSC